MRYINIIKNSLLIAMVALSTVACDEELNYGDVQAPDVSSANSNLLYVTDGNGSTAATVVEFRDNAEVQLLINATKTSTATQSVTFAYNADALTAFNSANGTSLEAVPASCVTLSNGGAASIAAGSTKSAPVTLTLKSNGNLDAETTYVIPLTVTATAGDAAVASSSSTYLVYVKDLSTLPDCYKTVKDENGNDVSAIKIFSCMEVNDTNPLNNLSFTLKNSGKYLVDALIIFSANINYNAETGRVYVYNNNNVQALLDNREHYLKPLQDRGMKVILGILGNHDCSGIANLSDETAKLFAKELKSICDAYDLDGIFWDDEYSSYETTNITPGFVPKSRAACSRLIYETWKAQPDRWNVAYAYSTTNSLDEVDGVPAGVYCQYALHDYLRYSDLSDNFPGMPKSNMGLYSQEFNLGRTASLNNLKTMRANGYGSHMIFAMDPNRSNFERTQMTAMENCAEAFYDDELVFDGVKYPKDY